MRGLPWRGGHRVYPCSRCCRPCRPPEIEIRGKLERLQLRLPEDGDVVRPARPLIERVVRVRVTPAGGDGDARRREPAKLLTYELDCIGSHGGLVVQVTSDRQRIDALLSGQ